VFCLGYTQVHGTVSHSIPAIVISVELMIFLVVMSEETATFKALSLFITPKSCTLPSS